MNAASDINQEDADQRQVLQPLLSGAEADRRALYWHMEQGCAARRAAPTADSASHGSLFLGTFVNSFYEAYWRDLAGLQSISFSVEATAPRTGPCTIRLVRSRPDGTDEIVAQASVDTGASIKIDVPPPTQSGVLHAEIGGADAMALLERAAWTTDDPPRRSVRLAVIICSFAGEAQLSRNLGRLASTAAGVAEIVEILVVHQGERPLTDSEPFATLLSHNAATAKLRVIHQANFGGCGGFARGMLESLDSGATHVLTLDDDIDIDPSMLPRLTALLRYVRDDTVVGGQMLDLRRPTKLHASDETIDLEALEHHNPLRGLDLANPGSIRVFSEVRFSNYNAWWMCALPTDLLRRIGLPLPFFIRHDDTEHGYRAAMQGARIVTMPGMFVWHRPFEEGRSPWISYYDRRNKMIAAAAHGKFRSLRALRWYNRDMKKALASRQYGFCLANCQAVEDFLAGPAAVFSPPFQTHQRLRSAQAGAILIAAVLRRLAIKQRPQTPPDHRSRYGSLVSLLPAAAAAAPTERRVARAALRLHWRVFRAAANLAIHGRSATRQYRLQAQSFTGPAFWRRYLGLDGQG